MPARSIDQMLTQVAKGWRPSGHVNELIMPPLNVVKPTGKIAVYGGSNLRLHTTIKSTEGETPVVATRPTLSDAYVLEQHAVKAFASDLEAENNDAPIQEQRDKAELVADILSIGRERALASFMGTTSNFTNTVTLTGNDQWNNLSHADSDPDEDIDTAVQTVADRVGCADEEVSLLMGLAVFRKLQRHTKLLDTIGLKYHTASALTREQLAAILNVKQVIVAAGIYNSADDGQSDVIARTWGKDCWAIYIPPAPKLKQLAFGYTIKRKSGIVVDKWYDNDRKGWWVRAEDEFDHYVLDEKCAYLIKDAVA